jgi:hypothetical protein
MFTPRRRPHKHSVTFVPLGALVIDTWVTPGAAGASEEQTVQVRNDSGTPVHLNITSTIDKLVQEKTYNAAPTGSLTKSGYRWTIKQNYALDELGPEHKATLQATGATGGSIIVNATASTRSRVKNDNSYVGNAVVLNWS